MTCWYDELQRRPPIYFGPLRCDTAVTHAEHLGDGKQRFYCDAHARWRRADIPAAPVRGMRPRRDTSMTHESAGPLGVTGKEQGPNPASTQLMHA